MITLRPMTEDDFARFWPTYRAVVAAQETYALDPAPTFDAARCSGSTRRFARGSPKRTACCSVRIT